MGGEGLLVSTPTAKLTVRYCLHRLIFQFYTMTRRSVSTQLFRRALLASSIDARVPAGTLLRDLIDAITHHYHRAWKLCSRPALSCPGRVCFRSCVVPSRRGCDPRELTAASRGGWRVLLGCERGQCAGRIYLWHADLRRHPHRREHECTRPSGQNTVHPLGGGGRGAA